MQIVRIDFKLELGALEETVEVSGESQVLQTETATVGEVISGTTLSALPLNGRNTGQLSLLLPGVVTPNPSSFTAIRNFGGGRPYVNGNREQTNNYTIDGVDMNESIDNLVAYQPSPDALAEISVETNNYAADTGNVAGAVISNVIKSGTNRFHGNVFEFYRNSNMDANSWSNNRSSARQAGAAAGHLRRHVRRAAGQEQAVLLRQLSGHAVRRARVRDDLGRAGDLAPRRSVERDRGDPRPADRRGVSRQPDSARPDQPDRPRDPQQHVALSAAEPRREPASPATSSARRLTTIRAHQGDVRVDWSASANDKIFGRFSFAEYESTQRQARVSAAARQPDRRAVPQPGVQLEPHRQLVARQRAAGRLQPDHHRRPTRSTGPASATPTRRSGSPAASRSPASARSAGAADSPASAPARATPTRSTRRIRSTRS